MRFSYYRTRSIAFFIFILFYLINDVGELLVAGTRAICVEERGKKKGEFSGVEKGEVFEAGLALCAGISLEITNDPYPSNWVGSRCTSSMGAGGNVKAMYGIALWELVSAFMSGNCSISVNR